MKFVCCVLALAALAGGIAGCGSDELGLRDPGSDEIVYHTNAWDKGTWHERQEVLAKFRSVQRDFYAGDVDAFCAAFNHKSATTFDPRTPFDEERCQRETKRAMDRVANGKAGWPTYSLHWVRVYHNMSGYDRVGGVTILGPRGERPRMGFVKVGGEWKADFDIPDMLEGLNTRMVSLATVDDAAATFAPLVRLHPRERAFPMSALRFVAKSGLEWIDGPCRSERDITLSAVPSHDADEEPLVLYRLGEIPGYEARGYESDCKTPRPDTYSTAMRTRLFDTEDRPRGLALDEGFTLDIDGAAELGKRRIGPSGGLAGVPAYYAIEETDVEGGRGLLVSYWLLYGRDEVWGGGKSRFPKAAREGDWERIDVVLAGDGHRRYDPVAIRLHSAAGIRRLAWDDVERTGESSSHPVLYAQRGTHALRPTGSCHRPCTDWRTWNDLVDVRTEPWYGYGGGWGAAEGRRGVEEAHVGPIGPSPYELGVAPDAP